MKNKQSAKSSLLGGIIFLIIFLLGGVWSIRALIDHERQRDLNNWQITLGIMADSKANLIQEWVDEQFQALQELAQNGSLQLYAQQLGQRAAEPAETEPAQLSYLRNLIRAAAEREGFTDKERVAPSIPANLSFQANNALLLLDRNLAVITATPGATEPDEAMRLAADLAMRNGKSALYGLYLNENNQPVAGFIVPVFAMQMQGARREPVGVLIGLKNADEKLFPLVSSGGMGTKTDESLLVRRDGDAVLYLSPLADGTPALKRRLAVNAPNLVAAYALEHPGSFMEKSDYRGKKVLATSRALAGLPWVLIQKIDVAEALKESNIHRRFLFISLGLVLLLVGSLLIGAWWYGSSVRERKAAHELRLKSKQLEAQTHLLNAINDNIADFIFLADTESRFIFANKVLTQQVGIAAADVPGKTLVSMFGPDAGKSLTPFIKAALESRSSILKTMTFEINGSPFNFHAAFIPIPYKGAEYDAVLVTLHDVTQLQRAQQRQTRLMQQIVKALMRAIDLHDPYTANHSAKTADVAMAIGRVMEIDHQKAETVEVAANLCNLGKLFVPIGILAKTEPLTDKEQAVLKRETVHARDILSSIEFEGAVIETITQKNEYLDGSGYPQGLSGEAVLLTGRILAVANAFVAMISPRAYREKLTPKEALDQLLQESGIKYDRHVVAALFHVVENEIDWSAWPADASAPEA